MQLIIAEKPSVAVNIANALGIKNRKQGYFEDERYIISWCVGHLVELVEADVYDPKWKKWSYDTLPIIPKAWQYRVKKSVKEQFDILNKLMHLPKVKEVVCGTDAGREGELIFRLVYEQAKCIKPIKRLWVSSLEETAILEGLKNLKDGAEFEHLYDSALCRMQADWLVGINATRLFSTLYKKKIVVGRVQTPTLAMLVEKESKIASFTKEKYYKVHIQGQGLEAESKRIDDPKEAEKLAKACQHKQAFVSSIECEEKRVAPPTLYDLTTLQREANRLFGYTAQQTLDYAQSLYEKKLLTYPRTDSQFLTDDMGETAEKVIEAIIKVVPCERKLVQGYKISNVLNTSKVTDHHGLIPTLEIQRAQLAALPKSEYNLLILVAFRLLCATGKDHIYERIQLTFKCAEQEFVAKGKQVKEKGWKAIETILKAHLHLKEGDGVTYIIKIPISKFLV